MHLCIDIGNTLTKAAVVASGSVVEQSVWRAAPAERLAEVMARFSPDACAVGCVGHMPAELDAALEALPCRVVRVNGLTPTPLRFARPDYASYGADRLAACVGAWTEAEGRDLLVVDAGTCITFDHVSAEGVLMGGNISPGLDLRLLAMHEHTALLPLVEADGDAPLVGFDTATAMRGGAKWGVHFEIAGYVKKFLAQHPDGRVFLGKEPLFDDEIFSDERVRVCKDMVFTGLDKILDYDKN